MSTMEERMAAVEIVIQQLKQELPDFKIDIDARMANIQREVNAVQVNLKKVEGDYKKAIPGHRYKMANDNRPAPWAGPKSSMS